MIYIFIAAIITIAASARAISFAIWEIKNKNILGGIVVMLLSISAIGLICTKF